LIPHKATVATARPVHYKVVHNTTGLTKNQIEMMTFHQCYNYVNFSGSIKVPSSVMYAHKISNYVHDNNVETNADLACILHYL